MIATAAPIHAATPVHAAVMAAIHARCYPRDEAWSAAAIGTLLGGPGAVGAISAAGGFALGRRAADEAEILALAVLPPARQRGLGRALLGHLLAKLHADGVVRVFLEVAETNQRARSLYLRSGFVDVGRRRGYYPGGVDAIQMRLGDWRLGD